MAKNKNQKFEIMENISKLYSESGFLFIINYTGLNALDTFELRKNLFDKTRDKVIVIKNSLHRIIAEKNGTIDNFEKSNFSGQNALIFTNNPLSVISILSNFIKENKFSLVAYTDKLKLYDKKNFDVLSKYPDESILKSALLRIFSSIPASFARLLQAKIDSN